jgi:hypothetical protein
MGLQTAARRRHMERRGCCSGSTGGGTVTRISVTARRGRRRNASASAVTCRRSPRATIRRVRLDEGVRHRSRLPARVGGRDPLGDDGVEGRRRPRPSQLLEVRPRRAALRDQVADPRHRPAAAAPGLKSSSLTSRPGSNKVAPEFVGRTSRVAISARIEIVERRGRDEPAAGQPAIRRTSAPGAGSARRRRRGAGRRSPPTAKKSRSSATSA